MPSYACLPPLDSATHHQPTTLRLLFDLLLRLQHLGYPPHLLATAFENILQKPSTTAPTGTVIRVSTALCRAEMSALAHVSRL